MIPLMKTTFLNEPEVKKALADFILHADQLSMNTECLGFETEFSAFQGSHGAVLFNSGGSANLALIQSLKNLGKLKEGDQVGFSGLTWGTNVMPLLQLGLKPVAIDCEPTTLNIMSNNLKERLETTDLKALFITNALGFTGDLDNIQRICNDRNILFIEDNCECLGTELKSKKTGTFGLAASFSFFVAHHMSTIEGGMVCADDPDLVEMLRIVRANGWDRNLNEIQQETLRSRYNIPTDFNAKYTFYDLGYNLRPTEITGFLGRNQLKFLDENIKTRQRNYAFLEKTLKENKNFITLDHSHISVLSSFAFPVLCKTKKLKEQYLSIFSESGVEVRPMIAGNIQNQPFYRKYVSTTYPLPGVETIDQCGFYFGNYPELTNEELQMLANCLMEYEYGYC